MLKDSYLLNRLDRISYSLEKQYENSILSRLSDNFFSLLRNSAIGQWFLRPEEEVDVFSSSEVVKKGVSTAEAAVDTGSRHTKESFIFRITAEFVQELYSRPIFSASIVILSAAIANTILWMILRELDFFGIFARIIIICIALLGVRYSSQLR